MFFTAEALEQATGEVVARYRADRFGPFVSLADLCCGIGGDTIALSEFWIVTAVDADPLRLAMAEHNLGVYGLRGRAQFLMGDLLKLPLVPGEAAFFDPDRRPDGKRQVSPRRYQPPPDLLRARFPAGFPLGMKMAPAIGWSDIINWDAEIEFISLGGELKECVAWFGPLRTCRRRSTLLPSRAR
jgi:SAM-dependent methyltransferase